MTDDCGNNVSNANVLYNLTSGGTSYICGPVTNATGNAYNCNFDTTGDVVGNYSVQMIGFKGYFNNGTTTENDAFAVKATPVLSGATIDNSNDGWGVPRTFSVNVTDNSGDNVTVQLWQDIGSGYQLVDTQFCNETCSNYTLNFNTNYLCSQKGAGKAYKFNATDTEGNSYETTPG